ncbi:MAG: OmpH family outer membrane protein [Fimbriimonadales bacterium]|nr:OmpH family outer membrane protein [Fimbriimonadales bacterium]
MKRLTGCLLGMWMLLGASFAQSFGIVDLERVERESQFFRTRAEQLQTLQTRYRGVIQSMVENIILTDEEREELKNLLLAENLNNAQQQRVQQLSQTARQRATELQQLRQKPQPTETEKAALERFTQMEARGREAVQALDQQLAQQLEQRTRQLNEEIRKAFDEVVAQVAKERKLAVVFNKSLVVLYAEVDITDEVIRRLNARKESKAPAPASNSGARRRGS